MAILSKAARKLAKTERIAARRLAKQGTREATESGIKAGSRKIVSESTEQMAFDLPAHQMSMFDSSPKANVKPSIIENNQPIKGQQSMFGADASRQPNQDLYDVSKKANEIKATDAKVRNGRQAQASIEAQQLEIEKTEALFNKKIGTEKGKTNKTTTSKPNTKSPAGGNASAQKEKTMNNNNLAYKMAAMGVGGGLVLSMANTGGQQSNSQLYGQQQY